MNWNVENAVLDRLDRAGRGSRDETAAAREVENLLGRRHVGNHEFRAAERRLETARASHRPGF